MTKAKIRLKKKRTEIQRLRRRKKTVAEPTVYPKKRSKPSHQVRTAKSRKRKVGHAAARAGVHAAVPANAPVLAAGQGRENVRVAPVPGHASAGPGHDAAAGHATVAEDPGQDPSHAPAIARVRRAKRVRGPVRIRT